MAWGPKIENVDFARVNARGEVSFSLAVDSLDMRIGGSDLNRLPIMGPSGAGKSTLLNLLSAISFPMNPDAKVMWEFPDGYTCEWGSKGPGRDILLNLRRKYFGYAFQTASLQPQLTIKENLTFGLENAGVPSSVAADAAYEQLVKVFAGNEKRATDMLGRYDTEVSGGERQRISLLQAFIRNPNVLFADEPTGSLDKGTRGEVMGLLRDWLAEKPEERLLFWVTHHDSDPKDNHASKRLVVAGGGAEWEEEGAEGWKQVPKWEVGKS
ncbi:ABC transporter ATP-binding protein [Amylibacter marinus]|uniref:ABC transporter ATP-binding protein n=1 Tax=Amylibacter marinus TaxID=1475483 RepID=A0ABQ5VXG5_9RHOB|nr:ATP-binding cassette domain-containing protein [Amylibacter marinus]GLQ35931.1 ABC transporter ATP-binding protein [Amylibacter marinus]